nr:alanine--tRNA ligase-related protein [Micromonospora sediminicola]
MPTPGQIVTVVLDVTTFFAESGGQVADAGHLTGPDGAGEVIDVQRPVKSLVAHQVRVTAGHLTVGARLTAHVDATWRLGARQAHSGTHVLHAALRQVLGPTALQSGSYNRPGYLRLDFAWPGGLSPATRSEVEDGANQALRDDLPVTAQVMPLTRARDLGALALFGETYDEQVRVVEIGGAWSRELCGGTHVTHSNQIGLLALTGESSVGVGHRRVEAVVGLDGLRYLARERDLVTQLAAQLQAPREDLPERIGALLDRAKTAERRADELTRVLTGQCARRLAVDAVRINGTRHVGVVAADSEDSRQLAELIRAALRQDQPGVVAVAASVARNTRLVVATTAATSDPLGAVHLVKATLDGRGGGTARLAQGGARVAPPRRFSPRSPRASEHPSGDAPPRAVRPHVHAGGAARRAEPTTPVRAPVQEHHTARRLGAHLEPVDALVAEEHRERAHRRCHVLDRRGASHGGDVQMAIRRAGTGDDRPQPVPGEQPVEPPDSFSVAAGGGVDEDRAQLPARRRQHRQAGRREPVAEARPPGHHGVRLGDVVEPRVGQAHRRRRQLTAVGEIRPVLPAGAGPAVRPTDAIR